MGWGFWYAEKFNIRRKTVNGHYGRDGPYIRGGQPVRIADPHLIKESDKTARKIINLLHRGVRFTPTQPDVIRIEKTMLEELQHMA